MTVDANTVIRSKILVEVWRSLPRHTADSCTHPPECEKRDQRGDVDERERQPSVLQRDLVGEWYSVSL
jgi:hypothetical protein